MIPIHKEPDGLGPLENCCFCGNKTPYWTYIIDEFHVACCPICAEGKEMKDVPSFKGGITTENMTDCFA